MFVYLPGKKYTNLINLCFRKMELTPKNLMWKCFDEGDEMRKILERELPDGFEYIVNRFKIVEEFLMKASLKLGSLSKFAMKRSKTSLSSHLNVQLGQNSTSSGPKRSHL